LTGVRFRIPYLESGVKVYNILTVDATTPWADVNEEIFLSAQLAECMPSKRPTVFFRLSSNKQLTYGLTKSDDWKFLLKEYRKELAKKGEDAAVEISFPDKVRIIFLLISSVSSNFLCILVS
jgi:hypothetical protein